jgi:hypothetical protein
MNTAEKIVFLSENKQSFCRVETVLGRHDYLDHLHIIMAYSFHQISKEEVRTGE